MKENQIACAARPWCAALITFAAVTAAGAQTAVAPKPAPQEDAVTLSPFVVSSSQDKGYRPGHSVSATRIDTPIKELPFAVSAYTEKFIEDINARELVDVLKYAPSVSNGSRQFGSGNSRSMVRGFESNPLRNGFAGTGYIDIATVQRVEVVKGPASLLYGQSQAGGAINYITKRPEARPASLLNLQAGSYNFYRGLVDVNQPLVPGRLFGRLNVSHENGYEYYDHHEEHTRVIAPSLLWKIGRATTLALDYQWFERREKAQVFMPPIIQVPLNNAALYPSATGGLRFPRAFFGDMMVDSVPRRYNGSDPNDFRDNDFNTVHAELQHRFSDHWDARAVFAYDTTFHQTRQHARGDADMLIPAADLGNLSSDPAVFLREMLNIATMARYANRTTYNRRIAYSEVKTFSRTWQVEAIGRYTFGAIGWRPLLGYSYNDFGNVFVSGQRTTTLAWNMTDPSTWVESNIPNDQIPRSAPARGAGDNRAVYAVMPFSLLDGQLQVVGGARWTKGFAAATSTVPSFEITKTSPQAGIGYKIRPDTMVYANISDSFQANNRLLRFRSNVATIPAKPFLGRGYEIGVKTDLNDGRVSASLAGFRIEQKNSIFALVEIQPNGLTFTSDLQDGNRVENQGVEFELNYAPNDRWQVYFSASYNDARYTGVGPGLGYLIDTPPEFVPRDLVNLWTRYSFQGDALKGLWLGAGLNYTGRKTFSANNPYAYFPDRLHWDATVGFDTKWGRTPVAALLSWKNITDEDDRQSSFTAGLPSRLILSLTFRR